MIGTYPVGTFPVGTSPPAGTVNSGASSSFSRRSSKNKPGCKCCKGATACCDYCANETPHAYKVTVEGVEYLLPYTSNTTSTPCYWERTISATIGGVARTSLRLYVYRGFSWADDYRIELFALGGSGEGDSWRIEFGTDRIACDENYTLTWFSGPGSALADVDIVPQNLRNCCCTNCDEHGTPDQVIATILDDPTVAITLKVDKTTCLEFILSWSATFEERELYGSDVNKAVMRLIGDKLVLYLYDVADPTFGSYLAWSVDGLAHPFDCSRVRTLTPDADLSGTNTPSDDVTINPVELKHCAEETAEGDCTSLCCDSPPAEIDFELPGGLSNALCVDCSLLSGVFTLTQPHIVTGPTPMLPGAWVAGCTWGYTDVLFCQVSESECGPTWHPLCGIFMQISLTLWRAAGNTPACCWTSKVYMSNGGVGPVDGGFCDCGGQQEWQQFSTGHSEGPCLPGSLVGASPSGATICSGSIPGADISAVV